MSKDERINSETGDGKERNLGHHAERGKCSLGYLVPRNEPA